MAKRKNQPNPFQGSRAPMTPSDTAQKFEKQFRNLSGVAGTPTRIITFSDRSQLQFELSPTPNPHALGGKESTADQLASSVKSFTTIVDGFEITFQDGSKLAYSLKGAATTHLDHPGGSW